MSTVHKVLLSIIILALVHLLLITVFSDNGFVEYHRVAQERDMLVEANKKTTEQNMDLYRTIDRLENDMIYIENIARQELGMIRPDEVILKLKSEPEKTKKD